jgi:hypothetical protein
MCGNSSPRIFLMFLLLSATIGVQAQPASIIPEFTMFREDKSAFTNQHLSQEKLLFFLFFDVKCEHCRQAVQAISKNYPEMNNTFIHMVTLDKPEEVKAFLNKYGKNLLDKNNVSLFFDLKNEFIIKFKPRKYPSIFLSSPQRKLLIYDDNPEKLPKFFDEIKKR